MTDKNLLAGKMMDAIQYGGKIYIYEPDARAMVDAALATNVERNARIADLEAQLAARPEERANIIEECAKVIDARVAADGRKTAEDYEAIACAKAIRALLSPPRRIVDLGCVDCGATEGNPHNPYCSLKP